MGPPRTSISKQGVKYAHGNSHELLSGWGSCVVIMGCGGTTAFSGGSFYSDRPLWGWNDEMGTSGTCPRKMD